MISKKNRIKTNKIIKKRLKQIKDMNKNSSGYEYLHSNPKDIKEPHRLAKRKAFGCNQKQCKCCHADKLDDKIKETEPEVDYDFM